VKAAVRDVAAALSREIRLVIARDPGLCQAIGDPDRLLPPITVESMESTDWASATFVGQHHRLELRIDSDGSDPALAVARLSVLLVAAEIELTGHFVAEIAVVGAEIADRSHGHSLSVVVEALTIED